MMTIEECYEKLGGDYADVMGRLPKASFVVKYLRMFLQDESYSQLLDAMDQGNRAEAFRFAHTIKGMCLTLSFGTLARSSEELTESLRHEDDAIPQEAFALLPAVTRDYELTVGAVKEYLAGVED